MVTRNEGTGKLTCMTPFSSGISARSIVAETPSLVVTVAPPFRGSTVRFSPDAEVIVYVFAAWPFQNPEKRESEVVY